MKILFIYFIIVTDTVNVGIIVPLPNHYNSDMPQGHGAVRNKKRTALFFLI